MTATTSAVKKSTLKRLSLQIVSIISLQTSRDRLLFFCIATCVIFLLPYQALSHLSLWKALDIPSPSIGLTRAYWLLIHGDPVASWERNRLIFAVLAVGLPIIIYDAVAIYRTHRHRKEKEGTKSAS